MFVSMSEQTFQPAHWLLGDVELSRCVSHVVDVINCTSGHFECVSTINHGTHMSRKMYIYMLPWFAWPWVEGHLAWHFM